MNADTAQAMGRGIGIERLRIARDMENRCGSSAAAIADDIEAGANKVGRQRPFTTPSRGK